MVRRVVLVGVVIGLCTGAALARDYAGHARLTAKTPVVASSGDVIAGSGPVLERAPLTCPTGALYSQPADNGSGSWVAGASEVGTIWGDEEYIENVVGVPATVTGLRWWGIFETYNGSAWNPCTPDPSVDFVFKIRIYVDEFCTITQVAEYNLRVDGINTGYLYNGTAPLYEFNATLSPAATFNDNVIWVSIQGQQNPNCWFLWAGTQNVAPGDNYCLVREAGTLYYSDYDPSICVLGTSAVVTGSCCNEYLGTCQDNVLLTNCVGGDDRFDATKTCAQLTTGCGQITGACCAEGGACTITTKAACSAPGNRWYGSCTDCTPPPCCDIALPGYTPEGEPNCGDGYVDNFNGGCNSTPPVFSLINCTSTIQGTSGTYRIGTTLYRDTDWYKLVLSSASTVTMTVVAEFEVQVSIVVPGVNGCTDYGTVSTTTGDCASFVDVSKCLPAGEYYIVITPVAFSGVPCGSQYTLEMTGCTSCVPPVGACCVNGSCVATYDEATCARFGGTWWAGQTCPGFPCECGGPTTIWDNGVDDGRWWLRHVRRTDGSFFRTCVDDIEFTGNATITSIQWIGAQCADFTTWTGKVDWYLYNADGAGGLPGTVFAQAENVPGGLKFELGPSALSPMIDYFFVLPNLNIQVPPGRYWFAARCVQEPPFAGCGTTYPWPYSRTSQRDNGSEAYVSQTGAVAWQPLSALLGVQEFYDIVFCLKGTVAPAGCAGDMNCDGQVDFDDIDRFVEALGYPGGAGWPYPNCPWTNGDCNGDNQVNFDDIDPFVARIGATCP